jgi:hypothetical protein
MPCLTPSWRRSATIVAATAVVALGAHAAGAGRSHQDPFAFFDGLVVLEDADWQRLDGGEIAVRVLPGSGGSLGVVAASRLDAPADALVGWVRRIEAFKQSAFVGAIRRFSDPPVIEDLDDLTLDAVDVDAVRSCRTGACGLKLAAHEIASLRAAANRRPDWQSAVQQEFRRVVYNRVLAYRSGGLAALPAPADRKDAATPAEAFAAMLAQSQALHDQLPVAESFLYWSKEHYGAGKRVVAVTHVDIVRPERLHAPAVIVLSKEILATHYRTASLGVTAVVEDPVGLERYLVYVNRSQVDLLGGLFGGLKRKVIEGRLAGDSASIMRLVRSRLESEVPPSARNPIVP